MASGNQTKPRKICYFCKILIDRNENPCLHQCGSGYHYKNHVYRQQHPVQHCGCSVHFESVRRIGGYPRLEIAEANGGTLTIVHVGKADAEPVIRKALSMGANEAIRIDAEAMDAQHVAEEISKIAGGYDLILTGRESIDYNGGAVCGLLGAMLGLPSVNVVTRIDYADGKFSFDRDIDGGRETVTVAGACVASAQKGIV